MSTGDEGSATIYTPVLATKAMRNAPRFGHSNDFSALFSGNTDDVVDYSLGLIGAGSIIIACFVIWSILLAVFKCMPRRTGFLSGNPFLATREKRAFRVRLAFLNFGIIFILFTVLLVTNGITNLRDTVSTVLNTHSDVDALLKDADAITGSMKSLSTPTDEIRSGLVSNLEQFCPENPELESETNIDFDGLSQESIGMLDNLGDFVANDIAEVQEAIQVSQEGVDEVGKNAENIDLNDWQALIIIIPYVIIPSFLLVAMFLAWFNVSIPAFTCLVQWVLLPLFILITSIAFVASGVVLFLAIGNADFCSGTGQASGLTPDNTVLAIMENQGVSPDDLVYRALQYYVRQCISEYPFEFINTYRGDIQTASIQIASLVESLESVTLSKLNFICGKDFTPLQVLLESMRYNLQILRENTAAGLELLACDRIAPLYTQAVYGGTCTYSITGFTWTFSSLLILGVMGMFMIMFRSALWDISEFDESEEGARNLIGEPSPHGVAEPMENEQYSKGVGSDDYDDDYRRESAQDDTTYGDKQSWQPDNGVGELDTVDIEEPSEANEQYTYGGNTTESSGVQPMGASRAVSAY